MRSLSGGMQDLVLRPGIEPGLPVLKSRGPIFFVVVVLFVLMGNGFEEPKCRYRCTFCYRSVIASWPSQWIKLRNRSLKCLLKHYISGFYLFC